MSYSKDITIDNYRCRFMVANKHLWNTLNSYGCTPKKSLTLKFPNENIFKSTDLIRHFIRGYFDGDGCITRYVNIRTVSPHIEVIGTSDILNNILKYSNSEATFRHDSRHSKETLFLDWNKEQGIKFINYLYTDCSVFLDRKYELYQFFKNGSRSVEEFTELSSGNIGETPEMDNTEITEEIKESSAL